MCNYKIKVEILNKEKRIYFNAFKVDSFFGKFLGLMFSKKKNLLFVFNKEDFVPLHMFFVFYSITVLFVSKEHKIVEIAHLKPWQIYSPEKKAKYIIEVSDLSRSSKGSIKELGELNRVSINDRVRWKSFKKGF